MFDQRHTEDNVGPFPHEQDGAIKNKRGGRISLSNYLPRVVRKRTVHLFYVGETKQGKQTSCTMKFREANECKRDVKGERVVQERIRKGCRVTKINTRTKRF